MATSQQAFDGDTLEAALASVAEVCGPRARITKAEKVRTGGLAGFFARERFEVLVEIGESDPPPAPAPPATEPAATVPAPKEPMSLLELADQVSDRERPPTRAESVAAAPVPSTEGPTFHEVLRTIATQSGLLDQVTARHPTDGEERTAHRPVADQPVVDRPTEDRPRPDPVARAVTNAELFASLGIPQHLLDGPDSDASVAQRLLVVLERTPSAPPVIARRGDVLVAVGEGAAARAAAGVLANQVGQTIDDVVVASPEAQGFNTLGDVGAAQERVQLWRRCGVPFVVAVCAPAGDAGSAWAREMVETLAPVATWGAVGADRKPEDVARWVRAVGGVDALALDGCDATASPAAVLATGIPVASLEGRRATPAAWTALLIERLTV